METKICCSCKTEKPWSEFYKKMGRYRHGLTGSCKECISGSQKKERSENPERYRARQAKSRKNRAKQIQSLKEVPCTDCKNEFPYYVMDFDHRPGEEKFASVSRMVHLRYSMEAILAEIAKCDVVCSNCHRIRTYSRKGETNLTENSLNRGKTSTRARLNRKVS